MNQALQLTFRLARTLGIIATVFVLSFMSSGASAFEESQQEVVTQEIELFLLRQEEHNKDCESGSGDEIYAVRGPAKASSLVLLRRLVRFTDRDQMNGLGTHLLI